MGRIFAKVFSDIFLMLFFIPRIDDVSDFKDVSIKCITAVCLWPFESPLLFCLCNDFRSYNKRVIKDVLPRITYVIHYFYDFTKINTNSFERGRKFCSRALPPSLCLPVSLHQPMYNLQYPLEERCCRRQIGKSKVTITARCAMTFLPHAPCVCDCVSECVCAHM